MNIEYFNPLLINSCKNILTFGILNDVNIYLKKNKFQHLFWQSTSLTHWMRDDPQYIDPHHACHPPKLSINPKTNPSSLSPDYLIIVNTDCCCGDQG